MYDVYNDYNNPMSERVPQSKSPLSFGPGCDESGLAVYPMGTRAHHSWDTWSHTSVAVASPEWMMASTLIRSAIASL